MKKSVLFILFILFFAMSASFAVTLIDSHETAFIAPCLLGVAGAALTAVLMFKKHIKYSVCDGVLIIEKDGKKPERLTAEEAVELKYMYGRFNDELLMICFKYGNKKHYIDITDDNRKDFLALFESAEHERTDDLLYYIIELFVI